MNSFLLKDKFIGSMLGTHIGDALGMPVEGKSCETIEKYFGEMRDMLDARLGPGTYTDDTEMMIALAESLVENRGFNGHDMARRFEDNFNPDRGYGSGTIQALFMLKSGMPWEEVGERVFYGGSFGNGSSMRAAPIGALYCNNPIKLHEVACSSSRITHSHILGMEGAALQAMAVAKAINLHPRQSVDARRFIDDLILSVSLEADIYKSKLKDMEALLDTPSDKKAVVEILGHDSSAPNSVPTAIYSFLTHTDDFEEAVVYAVSLGGDTDTIGAMTGAISGGFHGKSRIPSRWLEILENDEKGRDYIEKLAVKLWEITNDDS